MTRLMLTLVACLLVLATSAAAAPQATLSDIEDEVMCPTCGVALSMSESPQAERQRALIQRLIDQGLTKEQIKARLVDELGPEILASPPRSGFSLTAYLVPLGALIIALASVALALRRRHTRSGPAEAAAPGEEFEDLVDADLAGLHR
jgi:cytochrome c-type biogenesis protein CcmH